MTDWIPISLLLISIICLILSVFLYFYYGSNAFAAVLLGLGILLGLIACIIFIYKRTPSTYRADNQIVNGGDSNPSIYAM